MNTIFERNHLKDDFEDEIINRIFGYKVCLRYGILFGIRRRHLIIIPFWSCNRAFYKYFTGMSCI